MVQSAFAKIGYYKDKVASCEFSSYRSKLVEKYLHCNIQINILNFLNASLTFINLNPSGKTTFIFKINV